MKMRKEMNTFAYKNCEHMPIDIISSTSNPRVKQLLALQQKSAERRRRGMFVVEGVRELSHCLSAKFEVDTVFH